MTIIGSIFNEESPWTSMFDWTRGRRVFGQYSRLDETEQRPPNRVSGISLPIQFYGNQGYSHLDDSNFWYDDFSDSDCEFCDMNTNSRHRPLKARRCTGTSRKNTRASEKTSIVPEVIHIDDDECEQNGTRRKQMKYDLTEFKSASDCENAQSSQLTRTLRSSDKLHKEEILEIKENDFGENSINDTCSYAVYEYLTAFLRSTGRQIDGMKGDGNCFFRALSKVIYGNQTFYDDIRQAVVDVLERHSKHFDAFTDGPMQLHIAEMRKDKTWATQTEIYAAATLLNRDIYILSPDQSGETYRWLLFKPLFKNNNDASGCQCYITICHTHGNHYDRVAAIRAKCNCGLEPPEMSGVKGSVDLTDDCEIV